jgi:hypothetical protein
VPEANKAIGSGPAYAIQYYAQVAIVTPIDPPVLHGYPGWEEQLSGMAPPEEEIKPDPPQLPLPPDMDTPSNQLVASMHSNEIESVNGGPPQAGMFSVPVHVPPIPVPPLTTNDDMFTQLQAAKPIT